MTFRRFEMHHYRHVLSRMRLGETGRAIARAGIMGRRKIAQFREVALKQGWLDPALPLPEDVALSRHIEGREEDHLFPSLVEPYRDEVIAWIKDGVQGTTILDFEPGDAAQVDFGKGPTIIDVYTGEVLSTWAFVMTLAYSRHQYAEIVTDQKIGTWLGCHRRAFEFLNGVPKRLIIDNPKCAIVKTCFHDPAVQRSYAEYADG